MSMLKPAIYAILAAFGVIVGSSIGYFPVTPTVSEAYLADKAESDKAYDQLEATANLTTGFKHVAKALRPSVVSISTESSVNRSMGRMQSIPFPFEHPFFKDDFFKEFTIPQGSMKQQGLGTGFIVRPDGYIVTNHHVIRGADKIMINLSDKTSYPAEVVGRDVETDLAVLKIDAMGLQPVNWGSSDSLSVGEWVVAIGSPFGLDQTVTAGIVSALGRQVGLASYEDFIQTDAAINPGNSGGPLVNLKGELVGINTAIKSRTGAYNGIGFAIPAAMARKSIDQIIDKGEVTRGFLGVLIQDLNPELAESFQYSKETGVIITHVTDGGPAEKSGLKPGDILMTVDGMPVTTSDKIRNEVADMNPGTQLDLEVFRNGQVLNMQVTLDKRIPEGLVISQTADGSDPFGVEVAPLNSLQIEGDGQGVVVKKVDRDGLAASVGVSPGDTILSINGVDIKSVKHYQTELRKANFKKGVRMRIRSGGVTRFVFVRSSS